MANATPGNSRYVALTTYRRDGRPVTTPVWAVPREGKLYVVTTRSTGKAKRVRATGRVRFASCNMNGRRILGEWQEGTGRIVQDEARRSEALAALPRTYGWQLSLAMLAYRRSGSESTSSEEFPPVRHPNFLPAHAYLAVLFTEMGREKEAREAWEKARQLSPEASGSNLRQRLPYRWPADLDRVLTAAHKLMLP